MRSAVSKVSLPVWAEVCDKSNPGCSTEVERDGRTGAGAEVSARRHRPLMGARAGARPAARPAAARGEDQAEVT